MRKKNLLRLATVLAICLLLQAGSFLFPAKSCCGTGLMCCCGSSAISWTCVCVGDVMTYQECVYPA